LHSEISCHLVCYVRQQTEEVQSIMNQWCWT